MKEEILSNAKFNAEFKMDGSVIVSLTRLYRGGYKLAYLKNQPKVKLSKLNKLQKGLPSSGKPFDAPCETVPLLPVLDDFPETEVYDVKSGMRVTKDNHDIDKYILIQDDPYKIAIYRRCNGSIDVDIAINEYDGKSPESEIKRLCSSGWNEDDWYYYNAVTGVIPYEIFEMAERLKLSYGIDSRTVECILSFNNLDAKWHSVNNPACLLSSARRGYGIFNAIMMRFASDNELKNKKIIGCIIYVYKLLSDTEKSTFARDMKLFWGKLPDEIQEEILALAENDDFEFLNRYIHRRYSNFCKEHSSEELDKLDTEFTPMLNAFMENQYNKNAKRNQKYLSLYEIK